jgi:2-isopropylmalate synthase
MAYGLNLPTGFQGDLTRMVQSHIDVAGEEVTADVVRSIFIREYMISVPAALLLYRLATRRELRWYATSCFRLRRWELIRRPLRDAASVCAGQLCALGIDVGLLEIHHYGVCEGKRFAVYVRCSAAGTRAWGAGVSRDVASASRKAVLVAIIRAQRVKQKESRNEQEAESGQRPREENAPTLHRAVHERGGGRCRGARQATEPARQGWPQAAFPY